MELFIKICGITNKEDANLVASLEVNAMGLVMYENSPRFIERERAEEIINSIPESIIPVMVFVDPERDYVKSCLEISTRIIPQFHGTETPQFCNSFDREFIKALRVRTISEIKLGFRRYSRSKMILIDSFDEEIFGGSGITFNWEILSKEKFDKPYLLAGGLNPENIEKALSVVPCSGLDVSSGVESLPGKKDPIKLKKFLLCARGFNG